jgi:type I restriction-modification system DNA methylase subunit
VIARIMDPQPGRDVYARVVGSAGLLIERRLVVDEKLRASKKKTAAPLKLYGQENEGGRAKIGGVMAGSEAGRPYVWTV